MAVRDKLSHMWQQTKNYAGKGVKIGLVVGLVLGCSSLVVGMLTGVALAPVLGGAAMGVLNIGLSFGMIGSAYGALKGMLTRADPSLPSQHDYAAAAPEPMHVPQTAPQVAPAMAPQMVPAAPQQGMPQGPQDGADKGIAAALERARQLQEQTAQLSSQLQASGIGPAETSTGPEQGAQNWQQQQAQKPQSAARSAER